ncbi:MAG: peptidase C45 [Actinobacteria bacterium]|nr:peptidase C45 [Actinomycetota bacterium]
MGSFPHVRVEGPARERGRQYGEQAAGRVRRSIEAYGEVFRHYAGWGWETVKAEAARYREPIERFGARYLEEIAGIAEGAGVGFEDVLALNVRTEVMFAAKARAAELEGRRVGECSAFAVLPEASAGGHTLIGQNWDWLLHSFETVVVLETRQDEGPDFVTVVEAGLLAKTGMNSSGIGLATNALVTEIDRGEPGVPYHLVLRGILDSENISDALTVAQRGFRSSSANYLVASADGLAVDVEAVPGDFSALHIVFPTGGVLLHTNHFLAPTFDRKDVSLWVMPDSPFRLERLRSAVEGVGGGLTIDHFRSFLANHANHPSGICCHPDARMDPHDQGATVASVLMDLDRKTMWVADGHPCSSPYRELDYATFLSKPSPVSTERPAIPA